MRSETNITEYVKKQVKFSTPQAIIDALVRQVKILDEAETRLWDEGLVVRDLKGSVVQHPALAIINTAEKIVAGFLKDYKRK